MPCKKNGDCEQGRNCDCDRSADRSCIMLCVIAAVAVAVLCVFIYGLVALVDGDSYKGKPCEIEVQFKDSKATYVGVGV